MEERKVLIPLQAAHINQYTTNGKKTDWEIQENKTNEILHKLSNKISDENMFAVLDFAKKFELEAFNIGMKHMSQDLIPKFQEEKEKLFRVIKELETANEKLASKLLTFIGEEE